MGFIYVTDLRLRQEAFLSLKDPRIERHKKHNLLDILILTICAVISGAEDLEAIEHFGKEKEQRLRQWKP